MHANPLAPCSIMFCLYHNLDYVPEIAVWSSAPELELNIWLSALISLKFSGDHWFCIFGQRYTVFMCWSLRVNLIERHFWFCHDVEQTIVGHSFWIAIGYQFLIPQCCRRQQCCLNYKDNCDSDIASMCITSYAQDFHFPFFLIILCEEKVSTHHVWENNKTATNFSLTKGWPAM